MRHHARPAEPRSDEGREAPAPARERRRSWLPDSRKRVVLIEDDADIAEAISYQLEKVGLPVRVARTGEEGLEAVAARDATSCCST